MQRPIVSCHRDDDGDWVADPEGRGPRVGTPIDSPPCDRAEVPEGLERTGTTDTWNEDTLPPAFLRDHRIPPGTWGLLRVHSGAVRFVATGEPVTSRVVEAGAMQGIAPGAPHRLERIGPVTLTIEFFRVTAAAEGGAPPGHEAAADEGGDPACWAKLVCPECGAVVGPDPHREGCHAGQSF